MSNKRANVNKIFKCSVCAKADYKAVVPGAVTFFNRCTFTPSCAGILSIDPNADITARSSLTWRQTPVVFKSSFSKIRNITLTHNFGHVGALIVEVFVEVSTSSGISHAKTTNFKIISQTTDTVVLDLMTPQTGVVVITDNQFNPPALYEITTAWTAPNLLTSNIITIAADMEASTFDATLTYKTLNSVDTSTEILTFTNHYQTVAGATTVGGTLWAHYKVIAIEKPYFLYSVELPLQLQKGTSLQITGTGLPTIVWPMAMSQKLAATDIVADKIIRNSTVRLGDLVVDNSQLIVANSSIIEQLRKPYTIY
jgi:hypothetical protein